MEAGETQGKRTEFQVPWIPATPSKPIHPKSAPICTSGEGEGNGNGGGSYPHFNGFFAGSDPAGDNALHRRSAPPAAPAANIPDHNAQSQVPIPFDNNSSSGFGIFAGFNPAGVDGPHRRSAPPEAPATNIATHNAQSQRHIPLDINSSSGFGSFAGSEPAGADGPNHRSAPPAAPATNIADYNAQTRVPVSFDNSSSLGFGLFAGFEPAGANGPNRGSAPPAAPATDIADHNAQCRVPVSFDTNSSSGFGLFAGFEPTGANGPNRRSAPPAAPATNIADHNAQSRAPVPFDINSSGFSFAEFLAQANAPPPAAYSNATQGGFFVNQFMPTWNWNSQLNQGYTPIGQRHFPQELPLINTIHGNYQDPQGTPYFLYNTSSQVAPPAPNMAITAESSQVAATQLSMATGLSLEVRDQGGETNVPATDCNNQHNKLYDPDQNKEIGQGIDLNRTPQPKPKRKKHRPKVVREAKPKSTKTPATPKPEKRKNAGKGLKLDSPQTEVAGEGDKLIPEPVKKTCRRPLNFDLVEQPMDGNSARRENATTHWNREIGVQVKETQVLNSYMSLQEDSQTPSADLSNGNSLGSKPNANYVENGNKRGWLIGQDGHDKLLSAAAAQSKQHDSNNSYSQLLATRLQVVGSKRKQSGAIEHTDNSSINLIGTQYNSLQGYLPKYLVEFPNVQKKRRSEKGKIPNTFSMTATANVQPAPCPQEDARSFTHVSSSSCWTYGSEYNPVIVPDMSTATERAIHDKPQSFECNLSLEKRPTKRRSRVPARINDFSSLTFVRNWDSKLTRTVKEGSSDRQTFEDAERPQTCMDALVAQMSALLTKKKRSKKRSSADPGTSEMQQHHTFAAKNHSWAFQNSLDVACEGRRKNIHNGGTLTGRSGDQNLYREDRAMVVYGQKAVVPYKQQNRNYKTQGTMVPYSPLKKQRPKVDLDEETNKVWKLLMLDINSHGVDGTDEEKEKWWEEERNVFRGRADSFIARMHLVQGDRRFSQWKGSVVDSVVGVFLTQNVSDHLSSSAFMSLAARFPLKPSSNCETHDKENTSLIVNEPQVDMVEAEENGKLKEKILNLSACELSSMTVDVFEHSDEREVADSNDSCRNSSSITLTDESNCKLLESAQRHTREHSPMESVCPMTGEVQENSCNGGVRREFNDLFSSQGSFITSQISGDFSIDQNPEKISSDCNSEVEDLSSTAKYNIYHNRTSFSKLLEMAGSTMLHEVNSQRSKSTESSRDAYGQSVAMNHDNLAENLEKTNFTQDFLEASTISSNEYTLKVTPDSGVLDINCPNPLQIEASSSGSSKNTDEINTRFSFPITESESQAAVAHSQSILSQLHLQPQSDNNKVDSVPVTTLRGKQRKKEKKDNFDWDSLRITAQATAGKREKTENTMDSLDWDAVRCADVKEIADAIKERGMNNMLAERIKNFLNLLVDVHGAIDLEWLRDVPPDQAKEFLLSIKGLGLKSVECVRLLTLHQLAFPVDTNVGRIAVRLGWVPLQPLPESLQLHLLELYPVLESIQKYLWPRLCKLDQKTLYELHYQLITFGKVFCTKSNPNCNSCPMRGECRHFASAFASARLALTGPEQKSIVVTTGNNAAYQNPSPTIQQLPLALPENTNQPEDLQQTEVTGQLAAKSENYTCQPIIEEPATPEPEDSHVSDIEDAFYEESDEIPTIKLNMEEFASNLENLMQNKMELQEGEISKALVALHPEATFIPTPKLKNVSRLRTEHSVYELPDSHPLLEGWEKREPDDPGKYLLAIWTPGETANSIEQPERKCIAQDFAQLCDDRQCFSCNSFREADSQIVRGTILIPCRTAMRGSFPLNGTYFQVNEVFADHDSSHEPLSVPREWIWNLPRRTVYFGTSVPSIFKGLTTPEIQQCFWRGFVCVRAFERGTRAPRPLKGRLHFPVSKMPKNKDKTKNESASANAQGLESNPEQPANLQGVNPNPEQPELLSNIPHLQGNGGV